MRTIRIYQAGQYGVGDQFLLSETAGHHVGVVLRMQAGNELELFDGENHCCRAVLVQVKKNRAEVLILDKQIVNKESPLAIHLYQGISKGDRMEWLIQKAVELGVHAITPVITAHCAVKLDKERLEKKWMQWRAIAVSACEQSGRNYLPAIHQVCLLDDLKSAPKADLQIVLAPESGGSWRNFKGSIKKLSMVVGPEGGLSEEEIAALNQSGYQSLPLGPRILRTETAAITALSLSQALWGDLSV